MAARLRFALDQNFPLFVLDVARYFPEADLEPLFRIDPRLGNLSDRQLIIWLHQEHWDGLITNNHKMLRNPAEIAALLKTRVSLFAVESLGDDPLRATGVVLQHLPAALKKLTPHRADVFLIRKPRSPNPEAAWTFFQDAAQRGHMDPSALYELVKVSDDELAATVLDAQRN